jgi:hypothetical protein
MTTRAPIQRFWIPSWKLLHMPIDWERLKLFQELLDNGLDLRVRVTGKSMAPFLRGGEVVTIKKVPFLSLRRGDLVLCRLSDGFTVLHRIIRIMERRNGGFTLQTKGDGRGAPDQAISKHEVLGKVCAIERANPSGRCRVSDMESKLWRITNCQLAWISLANPRFPVLSRLVQRILSF